MMRKPDNQSQWLVRHDSASSTAAVRGCVSVGGGRAVCLSSRAAFLRDPQSGRCGAWLRHDLPTGKRWRLMWSAASCQRRQLQVQRLGAGGGRGRLFDAISAG
jgi:hypothetical protein